MIDMRRFTALAGLALAAATAGAQDTTVVVVRHIPEQQDTSVVVRHLAPPPQRTAPYRRPTVRDEIRHSHREGPATGLDALVHFSGRRPVLRGRRGEGTRAHAARNRRPDRRVRERKPRQRTVRLRVRHLQRTVRRGGGGPCREGRTDYTPAAIGLGVGITAWLYGVATAGTDVQHWNQVHGVRFVTAPGRVGFAVAVP